MSRHQPWHCPRPGPEFGPDWEQTTKLNLPNDAFQLAALHRHLVVCYRYQDADTVLERLRTLASRPAPKDASLHREGYPFSRT